MKIVVATGNQNKVREIKQIFRDVNLDIVTMKEEGVSADPEENGETFAENALIKARAVHELMKDKGAQDIVIADDSGLVIDALNGEPGVYSARYMGHETSYHLKNQNLIDRLTGVPDEKRTARFACAIAAVLADGTELVTEGFMEGRIGYEEKGENGFGYDPILYLPQYQCYSAELSPDDKNAISHRGEALRKMYEKLQRYL